MPQAGQNRRRRPLITGGCSYFLKLNFLKCLFCESFSQDINKRHFAGNTVSITNNVTSCNFELYLYCQELNLAISSSPVTNNNVQFIVGRTAILWKIKKFLAVRQVSA
jgi:hypothetical protein